MKLMGSQFSTEEDEDDGSLKSEDLKDEGEQDAEGIHLDMNGTQGGD